MATEALGDETPTLFLRKATGLVRGWSVRDSMIYACLSTNVVTLGIYEFSFTSRSFPKGQLHHRDPDLGGLGLVPGHRLRRADRHHPAGRRRLRLADPDPGQRHRLRDGRHRLVVHPLAVGADLRQRPVGRVLPAALGRRSGPPGAATWFATHNGIFVVSLITIALAGVLVSHRDGRVRPDPEVVLLRRPGRLRGHRDPAAGQQHASFVSARSTSRRTRSSACSNAYAATNARRGQVRLRLAARSASARSARACCWSR